MFHYKKIILSLLLSFSSKSNSYRFTDKRIQQVLGDEGCTYVYADLNYEKDHVPKFPDYYHACILSNGQMVEIKGLTNEFTHSSLKDGRLSGQLLISVPGAPIQDGVLEVLDTSQISIENIPLNIDTKGVKKVFVIRADAPDASTGSTIDEISDKVFGTFGDILNLKSQFAACSYNDLTFEPVSDAFNEYNIVNGIGEVAISTNVNGVDNSVIRDAMIAAANTKYGDLQTKVMNGEIDYVMLCLPPGTSGSWISYAYMNSWLSVYNDAWCNFPSAQIHGLGRNIGLAPSRETAMRNDQSGMMGYSYGEDEGPEMCFNAAKNWQLGWFEDAQLSIAPLNTAPYTGRLIGVSDYGTTNDTVVMQITGYSRDYYVSFNSKSGINSGTLEGGDQVLIHSRLAGQSYATSTLLAKLNDGTSYSITGNCTTTINVNSIDTNVNPSFAQIEIVSLCTSAPTSIPVPTMLPTAALSNAPTKSPTSYPTNASTSALTNVPTDAPTDPQTGFPTILPTIAPTNAISSVSTNTPSSVTINTPSRAVTAAPSSATTNTPSDDVISAPGIATTNTPSSAVTAASSSSPVLQKPTISEIIVSKGNLIDTISNPPNEFILTFELYPHSIIWGSNILRLTGSSNDCCDYSDKWLTLSFNRGTYSVVLNAGSTVAGNKWARAVGGVQANMWNLIQITAIEDKIRLYINDKFARELPNTNRPLLPEVKVYASDSFKNAANATIRGLSFVPYMAPTTSPTDTQQPSVSGIYLSQGNLIDTIPNPPNEFILTFELYPYSDPGWSGNILRFTGSSNDCCDYSDKWLTLSFNRGTYSVSLKAGSTVDGNKWARAVGGVQANMWNQIKVTAIGDKIRLYINDKFARELPNTNRPLLPEVKVYAAESFGNTANANIKNLSFVPYTAPTNSPTLF